jgi:hypothetical protein
LYFWFFACGFSGIKEAGLPEEHREVKTLDCELDPEKSAGIDIKAVF